MIANRMKALNFIEVASEGALLAIAINATIKFNTDRTRKTIPIFFIYY